MWVKCCFLWRRDASRGACVNDSAPDIIIIIIDLRAYPRSLLFLSLTLSVCMYVCPSVCHKHCFFFFASRISMESSHFLATVTKTTKSCSSIFDLGPLMPKSYSPKLLAITLHYHVATRGRALGTAALPGKSRQSTELRGRPRKPYPSRVLHRRPVAEISPFEVFQMRGRRVGRRLVSRQYSILYI